MEKMRFKSKTGEIKQTFLCELVIKFVENFGRQLQISCLSVTRLKLGLNFTRAVFFAGKELMMTVTSN